MFLFWNASSRDQLAYPHTAERVWEEEGRKWIKSDKRTKEKETYETQRSEQHVTRTLIDVKFNSARRVCLGQIDGSAHNLKWLRAVNEYTKCTTGSSLQPREAPKHRNEN